jgi:hypothetical protein
MDDATSKTKIGGLFDTTENVGSRRTQQFTPEVARFADRHKEWSPWLLPRSFALYLGIAIGKAIYHSEYCMTVALCIIAFAAAVEIAMVVKSHMAVVLLGGDARKDAMSTAHILLRHTEIVLVMLRHVFVNALAFMCNEAVGAALNSTASIAHIAITTFVVIAIAEVSDGLGFRG